MRSVHFILRHRAAFSNAIQVLSFIQLTNTFTTCLGRLAPMFWRPSARRGREGKPQYSATCRTDAYLHRTPPVLEAPNLEIGDRPPRVLLGDVSALGH
ncbi:hypothetical protein BU26DRAFT_214160 [Trematosphaeria pertusa]|uniref:Uncharacterized protein n=1 Tax=Trematosphaeria pertusa TaxID=390896 RepID=A0A6A6IS17_9PLEO|nr:uncharacterized protein BU26DRAFT_214160 [Trematosphaeria pertusa]KAF2253069.1 hypothetical protein BU26DRAFT_214160 [Trematosphaeria pertusa]